MSLTVCIVFSLWARKGAIKSVLNYNHILVYDNGGVELGKHDIDSVWQKFNTSSSYNIEK